MDIRNILASTAVGAAATLSLAGTATSDTWWETEQGTIYWDDITGSHAIFRFFGEGNEIDDSLALFIDGLAEQYSTVGVRPGTYSGSWYSYDENGCPAKSTGPDGKEAGYWGGLEITFQQDYNFFTAEITQCDETEVFYTLNGTPGKDPDDTATASDTDVYDFENGLLVVAVDQQTANDFDGYVSFTKSLPLGDNGVELAVTVQVIADSDYHSIEFVTPAVPSLDEGGGLGYMMPLWPYSSVWNLQKNAQTIYANGVGLDAAIEDLEVKFNGVEGGVDFSTTGNAADGSMVLTMKNK